MKKSNFEKFPAIKIKGQSSIDSWQNINQKIASVLLSSNREKTIVVIECYHGVFTEEIIVNLKEIEGEIQFIEASSAMLPGKQIEEMVYPYVTDDPVFGYRTSLKLAEFFDKEKLSEIQKKIIAIDKGVCVVIGTGASLIAPDADLVIYADMPRWEIQLRFRKQQLGNIGSDNKKAVFSYKYKRAFFVDWRVCDRLKKDIFSSCDFFLDTTKQDEPKMMSGSSMQDCLNQTLEGPFRVVPFFDPGPWGGQWLMETCDLDRSQPNFAWSFDCVPEENSLLFALENSTFEIPSINLVYMHPKQLLGEKVYEAFGAEFPIRFDFLDTMEGGNLSLQVHPLLEYIREKFGMPYTQEESYYFIEAKDDAFVYLGLKEKVNPEKMIKHLESAQKGNEDFDAEEFVQKWPIKKHDHILIPSGTVHCSGANSVVLEISATPFNFTFKLWDWGRMGLDGKPRPISLEHGKNVIQWDRTTQWTKEHIINQVELIAEGDGWREERTGLHEDSFIETRRHWFTGKVHHNTNGIVNVLNLIEGAEVIVESPTGKFSPYIIHFIETFIVPASVGEYTIRPYGESVGKQCATLKAFVRTENLTNYQLN
ncbi:MAG: class I mannose-6-phosphate isomerase [Ginsengibacter sp.]